MKDIIIVGTSKAGYLHTKSYKKIKNTGKIYYVDINETINNINIINTKVYKLIQDVVIENNINNKNVIVDICTPREEFYNIIEQCMDLDISDIIVEKPFTASKKFLNNTKLNLVMMQNYLYSEITKEIITIIKEKNYDIKLIYTNFSKNRIEDSLKKRGMSKKTTQNFEIEMPHQIYLANYILESKNKTNILLKEQRDFRNDDIYLEKHGYGKLILEQDNKIIIHESDLFTNNFTKEINIICNDKITINAEFILYDKNLNKIKNGKIVVKKDNNIILEKEYEKDDNTYNCLKEYYEYFNSSKKNEKYKERIIKFSEIFEQIDLYL